MELLKLVIQYLCSSLQKENGLSGLCVVCSPTNTLLWLMTDLLGSH